MAIYDDAVAIGKNYLGPAGPQFIDRQIKGHLKIEPGQLAAGNMADLARWCLISGKLIMDDDAEAQAFSEKIKALK